MTAIAQSWSKSIENMTTACTVNGPPFYHQPPAPHYHGFQFHSWYDAWYVCTKC